MAAAAKGLFSSTLKGAKRTEPKFFDPETTAEKARSLSRQNPNQGGRARHDETKTITSTPRGSIIDRLANSRSLLFPSMSKKLGTNKKPKKQVDSNQLITKKPKPKKPIKEQNKKDPRTQSSEKFLPAKFTSQASLKRVNPKKRAEKKGYLTCSVKESHNFSKNQLKKRLTIDDDWMCRDYSKQKPASKTPKEGSLGMAGPFKERIKKCLLVNEQKMKQVTLPKMRSSFKSELATRVKFQAIKIANDCSKEQLRVSSPVVDDDLYFITHRSNNSKKFKELNDDLVGKLKTELSVSTDKRSSTNQSPYRHPVLTHPKKTQHSSTKLSPNPRPNRRHKDFLYPNAQDNVNQLDRPEEQKTLVQNPAIVQQVAKPKKRQLKEPQSEPAQTKSSQKHIQTFVYKQQTDTRVLTVASSKADFIQTTKAIPPESFIPVCSIPDERCVPTASVHSTQCRFTINSEPKDRPEAVFESKPLFADRMILSPLPEVQDIIGKKPSMNIDIKLRLDWRPEHDCRRVHLPSVGSKLFEQSANREKLIESFEDIPVLRQQNYEETVSSVATRQRTQPIIAPRQMGLRPLMQPHLH